MNAKFTECEIREIKAPELSLKHLKSTKPEQLQALTVSSSCLCVAGEKSSVTLLTGPAFLAKNRCLLHYLAVSATRRSPSSSRLFVLIKNGISHISAKKFLPELFKQSNLPIL